MTEFFHIVSVYWKPFLEIAVLWFVIYKLLVFTRGSRALQVLKGLFILIIIFFVTQLLGLDTLNWILTRIFAFSILAFLIIFHPELRRLLARIGQSRAFRTFFKEEQPIHEITDAAMNLSKKKIGAIIAIEREVGLRPYIESGVELDSRVTSELLSTIFMPTTPLHDGGVIIENNRVTAAKCLFPLSQNPRTAKTLGTRHRAALGLTEETDAVAVVISEETGSISVAIGGKLTRDLDREALTRVLRNLYLPKKTRRPLADLIFGRMK